MPQIMQLLRLLDQLRDIELIQSWIDQARKTHGRGSIFYALLEDQQVQINNRRKLIRLVMHDIASRN